MKAVKVFNQDSGDEMSWHTCGLLILLFLQGIVSETVLLTFLLSFTLVKIACNDCSVTRTELGVNECQSIDV